MFGKSSSLEASDQECEKQRHQQHIPQEELYHYDAESVIYYGVLDLACLMVSDVIHHSSADKIDDNGETNWCPDKALCSVFFSCKAISEDELEASHQEEDEDVLATGKVPIVIWEEAEQAYDGSHKDHLSCPVERFGTSSQLWVVREADSHNATIELESIAENLHEA